MSDERNVMKLCLRCQPLPLRSNKMSWHLQSRQSSSLLGEDQRWDLWFCLTTTMYTLMYTCISSTLLQELRHQRILAPKLPESNGQEYDILFMWGPVDARFYPKHNKSGQYLQMYSRAPLHFSNHIMSSLTPSFSLSATNITADEALYHYCATDKVYAFAIASQCSSTNA